MATDRELVASVLAGETEAFGQLVERYQACVYGVAISHVADREAARDVAQEVFLRAFLALPDLREVEALPGWFRSIAVSTSQTWNRRNQAYLRTGEQVASSEPKVPEAEHPDRLLERKETSVLLRDALAALPDPSREALALYYMDGLSTAEAARFLGISATAVRQRVSRARRQLQQEVTRMADEDLLGSRVPESLAGEVEGLIERAKELLGQEEYQRAIEALMNARAADPEDGLVDVILAEVYREYGQASGAGDYRARAKATLVELIQRDPDNMVARLYLAELRASTGKLAELVEEQEQNLADARGGPFEPWALLRMARIYGPRRRRAEAARYYEELIEKEPRYAGLAHSELGIGAFLDGDLAQAREHYETALAAHQSSELAEYARQVLGERLWRFTGGHDPRHALLFQDQVRLAGVCAKSGDTEAARQHLREATARLQGPDLATEKGKLARDAVAMVEANFAELAGVPEMRQLAA